MPDFLIEFDGQIRRVHLPADEISVGRDATNLLVVDDQQVSRRHCVVRRGASGWMVQDLGSGNGTYVRDERTLRAALSRGDAFRVGDSVITFLGGDDDSASAATETRIEAQTPPAPILEGFAPGQWLGAGLYTHAYVYRSLNAEAAWTYRILKPVWDADAAFLTWLEANLTHLRQLDHPGLSVPTLIQLPDGRRALRERYADFGTLATYLASAGRLDLADALAILLDVARVLSAIHAAGLIHGGVRPAKIRRFAESQVRLATPGIAFMSIAAFSDDDASDLVFCAPEVFAGSGPHRSADIWSFGALAHLLLLNVPIGEGRTRESVQKSVQRGLRKPPRERRPELSEALADLLVSCLAIDPYQRPGAIDELIPILEREGTSAKAKPKVDLRTAIEVKPREVGERPEAPRRSLRFRTVSNLISAIIFILLNAGVYLFFSSELVKIPSCRGGSDPTLDEKTELPVVKKKPPVVTDLNADSNRPAALDDAEVGRLIHQYLVDDRYLEILSELDRWVTTGRLQDQQQTARREDVERKRETRRLELLREAEEALSRGDKAALRFPLDRLEKVIGPADPEFLRFLEAWKTLK